MLYPIFVDVYFRPGVIMY